MTKTEFNILLDRSYKASAAINKARLNIYDLEIHCKEHDINKIRDNIKFAIENLNKIDNVLLLMKGE